MRISLQNLAVGGTVSGPSSDLGYSTAALIDGLMAIPWRGLSVLAVHTINVTLPSALPVDFLAAFDVRARTSGVAIVSVEAFYLVGGVTPISVGMLAMNDRGDGSLAYPIPLAQRYWRFVITLSAAARLHAGELWVGRHADTLRQFATISSTRQNFTIANGDYRRKAAAVRHQFEMGWDRLLDAEHADLLDVTAATEGALQHVVIVPDPAKADGCYLGTLQDAQSWVTDFPVHEGHRLQFEEGRRSL